MLEAVVGLEQIGQKRECANKFMRDACTRTMTVSLVFHSIRTSGSNGEKMYAITPHARPSAKSVRGGLPTPCRPFAMHAGPSIHPVCSKQGVCTTQGRLFKCMQGREKRLGRVRENCHVKRFRGEGGEVKPAMNQPFPRISTQQSEWQGGHPRAERAP